MRPRRAHRPGTKHYSGWIRDACTWPSQEHSSWMLIRILRFPWHWSGCWLQCISLSFSCFPLLVSQFWRWMVSHMLLIPLLHWQQQRLSCKLNAEIYKLPTSGHTPELPLAKRTVATIRGNWGCHVETKSGIQQADCLLKFNTLEQGCVYISRPLTNTTALVLEAATSQCPHLQWTSHIRHLWV